MIHEVEGDILHSRAQILAHGVAVDDHFSSGLALALRERWPALAKDFRHYCKTSSPKPGGVWVWAGAGSDHGSVQIANLLTQEPPAHHGGHPGKASLPSVNHALKALGELAAAEGWKSLALPRLATGVGGLDWSDVEPLVRERLGSLEIPVFVYTEYHSGMKADEPGL